MASIIVGIPEDVRIRATLLALRRDDLELNGPGVPVEVTGFNYLTVRLTDDDEAIGEDSKQDLYNVLLLIVQLLRQGK